MQTEEIFFPTHEQHQVLPSSQGVGLALPASQNSDILGRGYRNIRARQIKKIIY